MNVNDIIRQNWETMDYGQIAQLTKLTADAVRKRGRRMGLEPKKINAQNGGDKHAADRFVKFLSKAKLMKEIIAAFGKKADKLLAGVYEGYSLFTQRNAFNELLYVLLPEVKLDDMVIQPRQWKFHVGKNDEGQKQPYLMVQLPDFKGKIELALLFDVHYGHHAHKLSKFKAYIDWILRNPNVYAIIGGDLMENAIDDGRGMSYDQDRNPSSQLDEVAHLLAPIAHKILFAIPGNHEERTQKKTGIEVMEVLARMLKIPYFSGPVVLDILANTYRWSAHIQHGYGNSQTKGGKMNSASRPKGYTGVIHFFISGHVHDRVCECETMIVQDPVNCRLQYIDQWTVVSPSFLGWEETYAYRAGYRPPAKGGVAIELNDNGTYRAVQT
jgi:hypothetical protein